MRTSDETIRWLERGVSIDADWREVAKDLHDLAAMEQRDRDGPCHYCGEMTEKHAGNPSRWPVYLCHADDPGVAKPHHAGCVSERLKERDAAVKLAAENEAAFDGKAEEFDQLAERLAERTAERDEARELLREFQFSAGMIHNKCPSCGREKAAGHNEVCRIAAAIGGQG